MNELTAPEGGENYRIISQTNTERGREFVVSVTHPVSDNSVISRNYFPNTQIIEFCATNATKFTIFPVKSTAFQTQFYGNWRILTSNTPTTHHT